MARPFSRFRRALVRLLVVAAAIVGALLIAEIVLRISGVAGESAVVRFVGVDRAAADTVWDPDLLWRMATRGGYDRIDAIGVRGEDFTAPKHERDLRILCVGDSCPYGLLVLLNESLGKVLDRRLQERLPGANVETVIAACPGYSTYQSVAMLRRYSKSFVPDITILYVGAWNDMSPVGTQTDAEFGVAGSRLERHPFWSLRLGRLLWHATHPQPTVEEAKRRLEEAWIPGKKSEVRVRLDEFRDNVRTLVSMSRNDGVVIGIIPSIRNVEKGMPWTLAYRKALIDVYRELGVPCVDSDDAFRAYAMRHTGLSVEGNSFLSDSVHPTPIGHRALAEALDPIVNGVAGARVRALQGLSPLASFTITSMDPPSVPAGRSAKLVIHGSGFSGASPPVRILLNDQSTPFRIVDDATIELVPPPEFLSKPGPLAVVLRSRGGPRTVPRGTEVLPWAVRATVSTRGDQRVVRACVDCECGLWAAAFVARGKLAEGRPTDWGTFRLQDPTIDDSELSAHDPGGLFKSKLPAAVSSRTQPEPKPLCGEVKLPESFGSSGPLFAQFLIRWGMAPESAWLSDVIAVEEEK